jgi:hypothetical protein
MKIAVKRILDLLENLYSKRDTEIFSLTDLAKNNKVNSYIVGCMLEKGLLNKLYNGEITTESKKGAGISYKWKHPEVRPNIHTAENLCAMISKIIKSNHESRKEQSEKVDNFIETNKTETSEKSISERLEESNSRNILEGVVKTMSLPLLNEKAEVINGSIESELRTLKAKYQRILGDAVEINILVEIKSNKTLTI